MPIVASDIKYRLSGGAANTDPAASLGGVKSNTTDAASTIFDDVSSAEASAGDVEYRCIYVHNNHGSLTLQGPKIWIQTQTPSATTDVAIGLGTSAVNGTEQTVANENTAPSGVSFTSPADFAGGLALTDLAAGAHKAVWVRRTINAGTAAAADSFTLRVQGDTNP
jgi:hypothetical protein